MSSVIDLVQLVQDLLARVNNNQNLVVAFRYIFKGLMYASSGSEKSH